MRHLGVFTGTELEGEQGRLIGVDGDLVAATTPMVLR